MNFKQIEIVGFKSFADPIKLTFSDGITAIVGPNGCGKSNVADAIRWVLGEQSSKMLRGTCMQDVIFKGTEKRKSLSYCEVSLCFDNSNKIFNSEFEEIVITRKLYRSGDSEYMINRAPCRLKDIVDMLHDSGIGKSGYSIIGQGKVEEIINSKPEDRRAIFEEAAGIAKFKFKKTEAERKLQRTQDNLTRINDIISEIDRQLAPLKRQSETAKIYLELKEKLKILEINEYIYQYDYASDNKQAIQTKIDAIMEEMALRQKDLDNTINDYNSTYDEINNIDSNIAKLRDQILELTVGIEKQAGETNVVREKLRYYESEKQRLTQDVDKYKATLATDKEQLYTTSNAIEAKQSELYALRSEVSELNDKFNAITTQLQTGENEVQDTQKKLFDTLSRLGDVKAQLSALETEKNTYTSNIAEYTNTLTEIEAKYSANDKLLHQSKLNIATLNSTKSGVNNKLNDLVNAQDNTNGELQSLQTKLNEINSNIITMQNRKKMLEDMEREYEGYAGSVKRLLTDAEHNKALSSKIVGVVASLIKVPQTYSTAIEMALGSAVQNIVTSTDNDAKELINYLKQREYGRVTFLPVNTVKPRYLDSRFNSLLNTNGCFGVASKLVQYDNSISSVVASLLGSTVIVNNITTAVNMAKSSNYSFRIVTLEGDIINPQGSITGGSKKSNIANLLSRENNIKQAEQMIVKLMADKQSSTNAYNDTMARYNSITASLNDVRTKLHDLDIDIATETEVANKYTTIATDLENQINKLNSDIAKSNQILSGITAEIERINSEQGDYTVSTELTESGSQFSKLRQKRDEYNLAITKNKVRVASLESDIVALQQQVARVKADIENTTQVLAKAEADLAEITKEYNSIRQNVTELESSIEHREGVEQLAKAKTALGNLDEHKLDMQSRLRLLEEQRMNLHAEVGRLQDKKYKQDLELTKIDTDIEQLQERVWTEYEVTYTTALPYRQETFDVKGGLQEINSIKREINKLGNINVNAIEDYKVLSERHGTMYEQAQDLIKAEDELRQIIKELSNEMTDRFNEEFNKINENFGLVFKELFGGGQARLELVESDDVLEAGVDIKAEPPGKKLSNITLLSGGEKALTAIAILFAILRLKPMPFCLLDEIEAALDEANVGRFAKYLRKYSTETQFIVITHKKPTMEHADVLYGVTMEEKGVSKIVSVKLSEAVKNVESN